MGSLGLTCDQVKINFPVGVNKTVGIVGKSRFAVGIMGTSSELWENRVFAVRIVGTYASELLEPILFCRNCGKITFFFFTNFAVGIQGTSHILDKQWITSVPSLLMLYLLWPLTISNGVLTTSVVKMSSLQKTHLNQIIKYSLILLHCNTAITQ
jgi:hypothetical protein